MGLNGPYSALELIGTIAFAVSGGAVAVRAGMDWLGVGVLAVVTAVGGGTLRDLLLGKFPINWIQHPWPVWVAFGTAVVVIAVAYWHPHHAPDSSTLLLIADAAGLAVFHRHRNPACARTPHQWSRRCSARRRHRGRGWRDA
jgi:uncharacterized membrane protein YeiH